ncbi:hypothetical protein DFH08DRAFT_952420 [Mycena albidolilacea]|uniref:Phosphoglycerate mutase n=1 Tax=Mycena albidolilacea TaxID=1033008 RepID=A0AAD7EZW0_9AGAR|nr:hypothetical protein DFH08DRAFT_952420 [Mycena albidolilacea]
MSGCASSTLGLQKASVSRARSGRWRLRRNGASKNCSHEEWSPFLGAGTPSFPKVPEGESLNDLAHRAESAIAGCVLPHLAAAEGAMHITIFGHGLCIPELVAALFRLDPDSRRDISYAGLLNTAWTRAVDTSPGAPHLTVQVTDMNNASHLLALEAIEEAATSDNDKAPARAFFVGKAVA